MGFDTRYFSRQLVLDDFGKARQERLSRSHALVAGLGGTGSVVAVSLATAGVGRLTLVDRDVVSLENLHRQPIYTLADIGMSKAEVASRFLKERVPGLEVDYHAENIGPSNVSRLVRGAGIAVDCLDNVAGRYTLNSACVARKIPMVHTGGVGWEASAGIFWSPRTACFECVFPGSRDDDLPACEDVGALGALTSFIASLGALESVKVLSGIGSALLGGMLVFDGRRMESHVVHFKKRDDCGACGTIKRVARSTTEVVLCGDHEIYVTGVFPRRQFGSLARRLAGRSSRMGDSIIMARFGDIEVSLFRSGGMLVKGTSSSAEARRVAEELGLSAAGRPTTGNA